MYKQYVLGLVPVRIAVSMQQVEVIDIEDLLKCYNIIQIKQQWNEI